MPDTTVLCRFKGVLNDSGSGTAQMTIVGPLPSDWVGRSLVFSVRLDDRPDATLETVAIRILD